MTFQLGLLNTSIERNIECQIAEQIGDNGHDPTGNKQNGADVEWSGQAFERLSNRNTPQAKADIVSTMGKWTIMGWICSIGIGVSS